MRIRTPCAADWDAMIGDDTVRFCLGCQKNVTNVDRLDEVAFRALVESGRACVRGRALPDGTLVRFLALAGAMAAAVAGGGGSLAWRPEAMPAALSWSAPEGPALEPAPAAPAWQVSDAEVGLLSTIGYFD